MPGNHRGLCIQRTVHEGPFDNELKAALGGLSARLSEVANLSQAVGRAALSGMTNALNLVKQPAMAVDSRGYVLDVNAAAEQLFDAELSVRKRRLIVRDRSAKLQLDALADQLRAATDTAPLLAMPIVVIRRLKQPLVIRVIPIPASSRSPFLGARVLLVFSDLNRAPTAQGDLIRTTFGNSPPAEVRLAVIMTDGVSLDEAAQQLGVALCPDAKSIEIDFRQNQYQQTGSVSRLAIKALTEGFYLPAMPVGLIKGYCIPTRNDFLHAVSLAGNVAIVID